MKKTPIFLIALFFLVILIPQVCAQSKTTSPEEAAAMRTTFVEYSKRYIGKPYARGAMGPDSFDCSGLVFACSRESIGVQLPRQTQAMFAYCTLVSDEEREVGDLVFFKTTGDGSISHVGIYAGNEQFINAASDGPNNGVILSSLKENYWKTHYFKTGRFLPASGLPALADAPSVGEAAFSAAASEVSPAETGAGDEDERIVQRAQDTEGGTFARILNKIVLDATFNFDWNFFTAESFRLTARGFSSMMHAMYDGGSFKPGVGTMFRYDAGTGTVQFPLVASITLGQYFRFFFGPVISFGTPDLPGDEDVSIEQSFFPGIIGFCWQTPSFGIGKTRISFQQDVHYSVFNDTDGAALSPRKSVVSGLVFSSGLRVTLPLASML